MGHVCVKRTNRGLGKDEKELPALLVPFLVKVRFFELSIIKLVL